MGDAKLGRHADAVDIILPTRNRPNLTIEAIQSVREQTYPHWRLFVVDDASDDATVERVACLAQVEARIVLVRRRLQGGSAAARQSGLARGTAPLVAILDSDDLWYPQKLEQQLTRWRAECARQPRLGLVVCWHEYVNLRNGRELGPLPPRPSSRRWTPFIVYNTSTPLLSRAALERVGGFLPPGTPWLRTSDHMDLFLRLTADHAMAVVPEVLVRCRHHDGVRNSDAQGTRAAAREATHLLELHADRLDKRARQWAWLQAWAAGRHFQAGNVREGVRRLSTGVRHAGVLSGARILIHYSPVALRSLLGRREAEPRT